LVFPVQSGFEFKKIIAIMIAVKKQFRINRTLIFTFHVNPDYPDGDTL